MLANDTAPVHPQLVARTILAEHLARFRTWTYAELADHIRSCDNCLEQVEVTGPDGTEYQMEFNVIWDDKPHGDIRVCGDLTSLPQKALLSFLPSYVSDATDSFIISSPMTHQGCTNNI